MIWVKTDGRTRRNAVPGAGQGSRPPKSPAADRRHQVQGDPASSLAGVTTADFQELRKLDLIAPAAGAVTVGNAARAATPDSNRTTVPQLLGPGGAAADATPLDSGKFSATLTKLISANLGLRGFTLTLVVDKASTAEERNEVAQRMIEQIRERKGEAVAAQARKALYGG